jgi:hypothetical protein
MHDRDPFRAPRREPKPGTFHRPAHGFGTKPAPEAAELRLSPNSPRKPTIFRKKGDFKEVEHKWLSLARNCKRSGRLCELFPNRAIGSNIAAQLDSYGARPYAVSSLSDSWDTQRQGDLVWLAELDC